MYVVDERERDHDRTKVSGRVVRTGTKVSKISLFITRNLSTSLRRQSEFEHSSGIERPQKVKTKPKRRGR